MISTSIHGFTSPFFSFQWSFIPNCFIVAETKRLLLWSLENIEIDLHHLVFVYCSLSWLRLLLGSGFCYPVHIIGMSIINKCACLQDRKCYEVWMVFPVLYGKLLSLFQQVFHSPAIIYTHLILQFCFYAIGSRWLLHRSSGCSSYSFQREIFHVRFLKHFKCHVYVKILLYLQWRSFLKRLFEYVLTFSFFDSLEQWYPVCNRCSGWPCLGRREYI